MLEYGGPGIEDRHPADPSSFGKNHPRSPGSEPEHELTAHDGRVTEREN